jgi:hypothetical protein
LWVDFRETNTLGVRERFFDRKLKAADAREQGEVA